MDEIRRAVPVECFERSLWRSIAYLVLDVAILAALYAVVHRFEAYGIAGLLTWFDLLYHRLKTKSVLWVCRIRNSESLLRYPLSALELAASRALNVHAVTSNLLSH